MSQPIYAVYPGPVRSRSDGDLHHVSSGELMHLYGVKHADCVVVIDPYSEDPRERPKIEHARKLIALRPRDGGDYSLPTK